MHMQRLVACAASACAFSELFTGFPFFIVIVFYFPVYFLLQFMFICLLNKSERSQLLMFFQL